MIPFVIKFVSRGLKFKEQLKMNAYIFKPDKNSREFSALFQLFYSTKQKNRKDGTDTDDVPKEKRMYVIPDFGENALLIL